MAKDPVLLNNIDNRDIDAPDDIVIPSKYNAVDDKRHTVRITNSPFAMAGPANYGQSVIKTVQRAIDEGRLIIDGISITAASIPSIAAGNLTSTNVQDALEELQEDIDSIDGSETKLTAGTNISITGSGTVGSPYVINSSSSGTSLTFAEILNESSTIVQVTYFGTSVPTCTLTGPNDSYVNIVSPSGTSIQLVKIRSTSTQLDSGNKIIDFTGAGLIGNTSVDNLIVPIIQKTDTSAEDLATLSSSNPFVVDIDNNPSVNVIGVGSPGTPQLTLRVNGLSTFTKYNLTLKW